MAAFARELGQLREGESERERVLHPANLIDGLESILTETSAGPAARLHETALFVSTQRIWTERRQLRELTNAHALGGMDRRLRNEGKAHTAYLALWIAIESQETAKEGRPIGERLAEQGVTRLFAAWLRLDACTTPDPRTT